MPSPLCWNGIAVETWVLSQRRWLRTAELETNKPRVGESTNVGTRMRIFRRVVSHNRIGPATNGGEMWTRSRLVERQCVRWDAWSSTPLRNRHCSNRCKRSPRNSRSCWVRDLKWSRSTRMKRCYVCMRRTQKNSSNLFRNTTYIRLPSDRRLDPKPLID